MKLQLETLAWHRYGKERLRLMRLPILESDSQCHHDDIVNWHREFSCFHIHAMDQLLWVDTYDTIGDDVRSQWNFFSRGMMMKNRFHTAIHHNRHLLVYENQLTIRKSEKQKFMIRFHRSRRTQTHGVFCSIDFWLYMYIYYIICMPWLPGYKLTLHVLSENDFTSE